MEKNVQAWVTAVGENEIESRVLVTNQSIVNVILKQAPKTVLDIGCGEGWLSRELGKSGINTLGIDIVPELITHAKKKGTGRFRILSYEQVSAESVGEKFDVIVCNFSLLGKESVLHVFKQVPHLLNESGFFIIQTIHPLIASSGNKVSNNDNKDGWRQGSWTGFNQDFCDPAPWYYRTLESWKALFIDNGFKLSEILEPRYPITKKTVSIIFIGKLVSIKQG